MEFITKNNKPMRTKNKMCTMAEIAFVEEHLNQMTNKEMAQALGATFNHLKGLLRNYKIKRSAEGQARANRDRENSVSRVYDEERERVRQGLPQLTRVKLNKKFLAKYQRV